MCLSMQRSSHLKGKKSEFILEPNVVTLTQKHRFGLPQTTCSSVEAASGSFHSHRMKDIK